MILRIPSVQGRCHMGKKSLNYLFKAIYIQKAISLPTIT